MARLSPRKSGNGYTLPEGLVQITVGVFLFSVLVFATASIGETRVEDDAWASFLRGLSALAGIFGGTSLAVLLLEFFAVRALERETARTVGGALERSQEAIAQLEGKMREFVELALAVGNSGLQAQYPNRKLAFTAIADEVESAGREIKFLGITNSIFWELPRDPQRRPLQEVLLERFVNSMCSLEFLFLEQNSLHYSARELAETGTEEPDVSRVRLLADTRRCLNEHVLPMYFQALERLSQDPGRVCHGFSVREYSLLPTVALAIVDDVIFVAPYVAMPCTNIPAQRYGRTGTSREPPPDYDTYQTHYRKHHRYSESLFPDNFLNLCTSQPKDVVDYAKKRVAELNRGVGLERPLPGTLGPYEQVIQELDRVVEKCGLAQFPRSYEDIIDRL